MLVLVLPPEVELMHPEDAIEGVSEEGREENERKLTARLNVDCTGLTDVTLGITDLKEA